MSPRYPTTFPTAEAAAVCIALNRGSCNKAEEVEAAWVCQGWALSQLTTPLSQEVTVPRLSMLHCAVLLSEIARKGPEKTIPAVDWLAVLIVLNRLISLWLNSSGK